MQIRVINGHRCTNRAGVAEHLGRSLKTVEALAAKRAENGFPEPFYVDLTGRGVRTLPDGTRKGPEWYRLDHLDAFKPVYLQAVADAGRARSDGAELGGDPAELLTTAAFAAYLQITRGAFDKYVDISRPIWDAHRIAQHATISGDLVIVTVTGNRIVLDDDRGDIDLTDKLHARFARYGGTWQPDLPGYLFTADATAALATLLAGDDFYLPPPDQERRTTASTFRRWRRDTAHTFARRREADRSEPSTATTGTQD